MQKVDSCMKCIHCTNTSQMHDCAFTSAPYPIQWFCTYKDRMELITDEVKMAKFCKRNQDATN